MNFYITTYEKDNIYHWEQTEGYCTSSTASCSRNVVEPNNNQLQTIRQNATELNQLHIVTPISTGGYYYSSSLDILDFYSGQFLENASVVGKLRCIFQ